MSDNSALEVQRRTDEQLFINMAKRAYSEGNEKAQRNALKSLEILRETPLEVTALSQAKELGTTALGMADTALNVGTGAVASLGGGLTYAGAAPIVGDEAAQVMKSGVEEAFTYQPRTERGQEYQQNIGEAIAPVSDAMNEFSTELGDAELARGGSPAMATAEFMAPQILAETVSFLFTGGLARLARYKAGKLNKRAGKEEDRFNRISKEESEMEGFKETVDTIRNADPELIAQMIDADPRIVQIIDDLGIDVEPLAAVYSRNPQYRAIEMGLASKDASDLNIQYKEFISAVSRKADEIIEAGEGQINKADLSDTLKEEFLKSIDDLYQAENIGYENMRKLLPATSKVNPENTINFLEGLIREAGGIENIDTQFATLYRSLKPKQKASKTTPDYGSGKKTIEQDAVLPNYGLLNQQRQLVGQQLSRKGNTHFKNSDQRHLAQLYSNMKKDQQGVIDSHSVNSPQLKQISEFANRNTIQRKKLESQIIDLAGKDLDKNIVNLVGSAIARLSKGEWDKFDRVMTNLEGMPKRLREQTVLSAMNNAWSATAASKQAFGEAQFARFWTAIEREPKLKKRLMDNLPEGSRKSVQNLGELSQAIYKANQDKIDTGRLNDFFADSGGSLNQLANRLIPHVASAVLPKQVGYMVGSNVKTLLENSTDGAKAANKMLADGRFKRIITEAVKEDVHISKPLSDRMKRVQKDYMKSEKYQKWAETLEKADQDKLVAVGVVNYLLNPRMEQLNNTSQETQ